MWLPSLLLSLALSAAPLRSGAAPSPPEGSSAEDARLLERRLLAPCCWRETLDLHESPIASGLRAEIRRRLSAGESSAAIEQDLVRRHGPRIRAVLPDGLGPLLYGVLTVSGLAGLLLARRWTRRGRSSVTGSAGAAPAPAEEASLAADERRALEQRLDDDLD